MTTMGAKRIIILFSDAGGGHRSAGEAIAEALAAQYGAAVEVALVDALKQYTRWPINRLPEWYPAMIAKGRLGWGLTYWLMDGRPQMRVGDKLVWPYVRAEVARFLRDHPADLYISVHPAMCLLMHELRSRGTPLITVVTDLVSTHALWYSRLTNLCIVPTEAARQTALLHGYQYDQVRVVGLPVAARFGVPAEDRAALKARLGWSPDRPTVLVMGGGEGMGPLFKIAQAIAHSGLACELAVVAGRNQALQAQLQAAEWPVPAHIYGFVREVPDFMRAATVLVSKAGPGTICEALSVGLPMILYSRVPGQEAGNAAYVADGGAGAWAPGPQRVVAALRRWIGPDAQPEALAQARAAALRLARPHAAREIAEIAWSYVAPSDSAAS